MGKYNGPKRRLSRREGVALFKKDIKSIERKGAVPPGMRGTKSRSRFTEYGTQLREKQKAKRMFGLSEKQFRLTYEEAARVKEATGKKMLEFLETRLDNVVYRLGFAASRAQARQLVGHGHVVVDSKKLNIPSAQVRVNSVVAISSKIVDNTQIKKNVDENPVVPSWLERKGLVGKMVRLPERDEMEKGISEQLIVEFYSR
jgi:small subunit ribosomal protein S4